MLTYVSRGKDFKKEDYPLPFFVRSTGHYTPDRGWSETIIGGAHISLYWIDSGTFEFTILGKKDVLGAGDVAIYFPFEEKHTTFLSEKGDMRWLTLDGPLALAFVGAYAYPRILRNAGPVPKNLFQKIAERLSENDVEEMRNHVALVSEILSLAGKGVSQQEPSGILFNQIMNLIEKKYSDPALNVNEICEKTGFSRATVYRICMEKKKLPPRILIRNHRIAAAGRLLRGTSLPVREIAERCGFLSLGSFCRFFKQASGMNPLEFRRRQGVD